MKLFLIFLLLKICTCEIQLPEGIKDAKDALESEVNRAAIENLIKTSQIDESTKVEGRVTGGSVAALGQFKWQALIYMSDGEGHYLCGGSLINYKTVLTAAHCIDPFTSFSVYLGVVYLGPGGTAQFGQENLSRSKTYFHANYNPAFFWNDIGLIYLTSATENILNNPYVGLIALPMPSDALINLVGRNATVAGFGKAYDGGSASLNLLYANTPIVSNQVCNATFASAYIRDTLLCSSGANGVSSCSGDSGGGLTTEITPGRLVVVGLVSFGAAAGCQFNYPSGNTRVTSYLNWIDEYGHVNRTQLPNSSDISSSFSSLTLMILFSLLLLLK